MKPEKSRVRRGTPETGRAQGAGGAPGAEAAHVQDGVLLVVGPLDELPLVARGILRPPPAHTSPRPPGSPCALLSFFLTGC